VKRWWVIGRGKERVRRWFEGGAGWQGQPLCLSGPSGPAALRSQISLLVQGEGSLLTGAARKTAGRSRQLILLGIAAASKGWVRTVAESALQDRRGNQRIFGPMRTEWPEMR